MKNDKTLLEAALAAYRTGDGESNARNKHPWSSPAWFAHEIGLAMANRGVTEPVRVAMSRGYSIRAETASYCMFRLTCPGPDLENRSLEREV